jgi:hypothetical protein
MDDHAPGSLDGSRRGDANCRQAGTVERIHHVPIKLGGPVPYFGVPGPVGALAMNAALFVVCRNEGREMFLDGKVSEGA